MTASPKAIALQFLDAIAGGDVARVDSLLHPSALYWVQGWGNLPRDAFFVELNGLITRATSRKMEITSVTAEEDRVAITAEGDFLLPEGSYRNSYSFLFTIADGQIVSGREYLDTMIAARFYKAPDQD